MESIEELQMILTYKGLSEEEERVAQNARSVVYWSAAHCEPL